jgi:hypothetical protein
VGVIEMGRFAYFSILVGNAARAGAAYGVQGNTESTKGLQICNAASNDFQGATSSLVVCTGSYPNYQSKGPDGTLNITTGTTCGCDSGGTVTIAAAGCSTQTNPNAGICATGHWVVMVWVTASGAFQPLFKYPGLPQAVTVSRTTTMRVNTIGM